RDPRDRLRAAGGESGRGAGGGKDRRERDGGGGAGAAEGGGDAGAARAWRVRLACVKEAPLRHAPIAQLDRASDYESEGRVFESPWAHSRRSVVRQSLQPSQELADLRASSLSPRLGGAHEALRRNAFDL